MSNESRIPEEMFEGQVSTEQVESNGKRKSRKKKGKPVEVDTTELEIRVIDLEEKVSNLESTLQIVMDTVGEIQAAPAPAVKQQGTGSSAPRLGKGVFGYSSAAMLRWMGNKGWSNKQCMLVLMAYNLDVSPATIQTQRQLGRKDTDAKTLPTLTDEQVVELTAKRDAACALMNPTATEATAS